MHAGQHCCRSPAQDADALGVLARVEGCASIGVLPCPQDERASPPRPPTTRHAQLGRLGNAGSATRAVQRRLSYRGSRYAVATCRAALLREWVRSRLCPSCRQPQDEPRPTAGPHTGQACTSWRGAAERGRRICPESPWLTCRHGTAPAESLPVVGGGDGGGGDRLREAAISTSCARVIRSCTVTCRSGGRSPQPAAQHLG